MTTQTELATNMGNGNSNDDRILAILAGETTKFEEQAIAKSILENVKRANNFIGTWQEWVHSRILIPATILAWKTKNTNIVRDVLNGFANGNFKTIRVESLAYWLEEFAGFRVNYSRASNEYKVRLNFMGNSKHPGVDLKFSYDSHQLNTYLKNENYRYWKVSPAVIREIKVPDNADKLFEGLEKKLALAILVGNIDLQTIRNRLDKLLPNVEKDLIDSKIRDKAEDYRIQQLELGGLPEELINTSEPIKSSEPEQTTESTVPSPTDTVVTETTNESPAS